MNILGHSYIATKVVFGNRNLLIIGALLPESFPFIASNPFVKEEIHEGGEALLQFLNRNYPHKRDLALGILAHSAKFGADGFNKHIEGYMGDKKETFLREIAEASGISLEIAEYRLHNFLWWGVDLWILKEYPDLAREVCRVIRRVDIKKISGLLAEAFQKDQQEAGRVFKKLFREIYRPEDLTSAEGLARTWARQAAGLPEQDRVNVPKAAEIMEECAGLLKNDWQKIISLVEERVGESLRPLIEKEGVRRNKKELLV